MTSSVPADPRMASGFIEESETGEKSAGTIRTPPPFRNSRAHEYMIIDARQKRMPKVSAKQSPRNTSLYSSIQKAKKMQKEK